MNTRLLVSETMQRDPLVEPGDTTIMEAARAMRDHGTGCLLVQNHHGLAGILTERDILHKVVAEGRDPRDVRVRDAMTPNVLTVTSATTVADALRLMKARDIRRLPIVDNGRLVGLVTEHLIGQVAPDLIEIAQDWEDIAGNGVHTDLLATDGLVALGYRSVRRESIFPGACESCGNMDTDLIEANGGLLCRACLEAELEATETSR